MSRTMILSSFLLMSFLSCVKTQVDAERTQDIDREEITFGSSLTRAAVTTDQNGTISGMSDYAVWGWFRSADGGIASTTVFDNTLVNHSSGTYEGARYWIDGMLYNFFSIHPAGMESGESPVARSVLCNSDGTMTVKGFDSSRTGDEAVDFMTAKSGSIPYFAGQTQVSVPLRFGHELSRVAFFIDEVAENLTVNYVEITGIAYKGDYQTPSGQETDPWTNRENIPADNSGTTPNPFRKVINRDLTPADKNFDLFGGDLLLIPQGLNGNCVFTMSWTYKTSGKERTVHVPFTEVAYSKWEKGKSYRYSASIPSYESDVTLNVKVQDWNAKTTIDVELN